MLNLKAPMNLLKASALALTVSVAPTFFLSIYNAPARAGLPDLSTAGRDACRDVAIGNDTNHVKVTSDNSSDERLIDDTKNTHDNNDMIALNSSSDTRVSSDTKDTEESSGKNSENKSGNVGFAGFKFGGSSQESNENTHKRDNSEKIDNAQKINDSQKVDSSRKGDNSQKTDNSSQARINTTFEQSTSTVRAGKSCDGIADSITKVEVNRQDNETNLEIAEKKLEAEKAKIRLEQIKGLMDW